jgi:LPS-assembly lipoprotein
VREAFATVDVDQIAAPNGTPEARIAVELRNDMIWQLTGGGGAGTPAYRLGMKMKLSKTAMIVDIQTGRTEAEVVGIDVYYTLTEIGTKKVVVNSQTFARVSSDVPGLQQRFAHQRAQRDAEDRATKVIAEQIRTRLASYFVAGT